jgi:hypothetical protein
LWRNQVYAADLKSAEETHVGSIPTSRTKLKKKMTNEEILKNSFALVRTYSMDALSIGHMEAKIRCNSKANNSAIGALNEITITEFDEIVIVRSAPTAYGIDYDLDDYIEFEIREYKRTPDYHDGETINSDR